MKWGGGHRRERSHFEGKDNQMPAIIISCCINTGHVLPLVKSLNTFTFKPLFKWCAVTYMHTIPSHSSPFILISLTLHSNCLNMFYVVANKQWAHPQTETAGENKGALVGGAEPEASIRLCTTTTAVTLKSASPPSAGLVWAEGPIGQTLINTFVHQRENIILYVTALIKFND